MFPYGAVYFRKSNPPREDWERDYRVAAEDGHNVFRHWFLWSAIEIAPGKYDWDDYDRQLDLAAQNGIKTVIAEMMTAAPEWAFRTMAHARYERRDGSPVTSTMSPSCVTGGFPGLCLDNPDAQQAAGDFLRALVSRYKDHPGMGAYDIWNECGYQEDVCYCPASAAKFRTWLANKYTDLTTLGNTWGRHSYRDWDDIQPPRQLAPYPDVLDWLEFRQDNAYDLMAWRTNIIRELDTTNTITAHGVAGSLTSAAPRGTDDWKAAQHVQSYGLTWGSSRHGDDPWKQLHAMDLVRAASRGKPFWHAESYAGPLWMQPQVVGKPRDQGRIASPDDVRYWNMVSFAGGATGIMYLRWRPLLDGPLFGAFGAYGMDGSRTDRSQMASTIATWANNPDKRDLWNATPITGDIGIIYAPETQVFTYAQQGTTDHHRTALQGAYQAFFDNNIQADFVHIDDIDHYQRLYLPYPVHLTTTTVNKITTWVHNGGTLISEGCPAYFTDHGRANTTQPGGQLHTLFGANETYIEFTPDLLHDLTLNVDQYPIHGGTFLQAYQPTTGTPTGTYQDGQTAAIDHHYGNGRTKLIGTFPSIGYHHHRQPTTKNFFANLLHWAGHHQHLTTTNPTTIARLHNGPTGRYLWILNPTRQPQHTTITLAPHHKPITTHTTHWGNHQPHTTPNTITTTINPRDAHILHLHP